MEDYRRTCSYIRKGMGDGNWVPATTKYLCCPVHVRIDIFSAVKALLHNDKRISQYWEEIGRVLQYEPQLTPLKDGKTILPSNVYDLLNSLKHYSESARETAVR